MTKAEFVELVKSEGGFESKALAEKAVKAFTDAITEALKKRETVTLVGFGTFSTAEIPPREGKVPGTNKSYKKPAYTAPKFKFGKTIKDAVA